MRDLYLKLRRNDLRLVFAALFLFVLLAEFSSHVMAHVSTSHSQEEQLVSIFEDGNGERCRHVLPCCDNGQSDPQVPNAGHQLIHNSLAEIAQFVPKIEINFDPPIPLEQADALFRESSPPFHPPRLS